MTTSFSYSSDKFLVFCKQQSKLNNRVVAVPASLPLVYRHIHTRFFPLCGSSNFWRFFYKTCIYISSHRNLWRTTNISTTSADVLQHIIARTTFFDQKRPEICEDAFPFDFSGKLFFLYNGSLSSIVVKSISTEFLPSQLQK